jgi:hypothetical protein
MSRGADGPASLAKPVNPTGPVVPAELRYSWPKFSEHPSVKLKVSINTPLLRFSPRLFHLFPFEKQSDRVEVNFDFGTSFTLRLSEIR